MSDIDKDQTEREQSMAEETEVMYEPDFCKKHLPDDVNPNVRKFQYNHDSRQFFHLLEDMSEPVANLPEKLGSVEILVLIDGGESMQFWGYATLIGPEDKIGEIQEAENRRRQAAQEVNDFLPPRHSMHHLRPKTS